MEEESHSLGIVRELTTSRIQPHQVTLDKELLDQIAKTLIYQMLASESNRSHVFELDTSKGSCESHFSLRPIAH